MKTNQMMEVSLGKFGNVTIGHLTQMGNLSEVLEIGNEIRETKGLKPKKLDTYLRSRNTWELILKVYNEEIKKEFPQLVKKSNMDSESVSPIGEKELDDSKNFFVNSRNTFYEISEKVLYQETLDDLPQDTKGQIKYSEIAKTKVFDSIFKIQNRGKLVNRGTWANLFIMLDLAQWLDVDLRYEIYRVFIEEKILIKRDDGGEEFKKLNILIDGLPDRIKRANEKGVPPNKANNGIYIQIAKRVNEKVKGEFLSTWNKNHDDSIIQEKRIELLDKLSFAIEYNLITNYAQLKVMIENYKF